LEAIVQSGRPTGYITTSRVSEALTMMAGWKQTILRSQSAKQESHARLTIPLLMLDIVTDGHRTHY
jgi:hypothetical protein